MLNKSKKIISTIAIAVALAGCADLSVENLNAPDEKRAITNPADYVTLLEGSTSDVFFKLNDLEGVHMDLLADVLTTTNRYASFWDYAFQPRQRLNNTSSFSNRFIINGPWSTFYSGISSANDVIRVIGEGAQLILDDGTDVTQKSLVAAHFLRGVAYGYLGSIYDKALIIDEDAGVGIAPSSYIEVIEFAVKDLEKAIEEANKIGDSFVYDAIPGSNFNLVDFKAFANSMAARFIANKPRSDSEAKELSATDAQRIINFANAGVGKAAGATNNIAVPTITPYEYYNNYADWLGFWVVNGTAAYLPTDIRVIHLLDPGYAGTEPPFDFVQNYEGTTLLPMPPHNSTDPRGAYYAYTDKFGFLSLARDRRLFSNYGTERFYADNDWGTNDTRYAVTYVVAAEMDYLIAEAEFRKGDKAAAKAALERSPFGTGVTDLEPLGLPTKFLGYLGADGFSGGHTIAADAPDDAFVYALQLEFAVELHVLNNIGGNWFFMRRHDLLQKGTPLHYPIPGAAIEVTPGLTYYSFGGEGSADGINTALGQKDWRMTPLVTTGITNPPPAKAPVRVDIKNRKPKNNLSGKGIPRKSE